MTGKLLLQMIFGIFSFNPKNMRWFNFRRITVSIFLLPIFIVTLLINNLFLLLDYLLFPLFLRQKITEPVYIIAAPRSATTYLFHNLAQDNSFTCFKLWEIIFAPSIFQKYVVIFALRIDKVIGSPIKRVARFIEGVIVGRINEIHKIGFSLPEEDDAVLLWSLSSFYLNFFYPDSNFFDNLALFDERIIPRRRTRIMKAYSRYVKRHNFVFNRSGEKKFLSKNPLMMTKVKSLSEIFPDALILNINRSPAKTLPSTIALNRALYALFTSMTVPDYLNKKTIAILIQWYKMAYKNIEEFFPNQHLKIAFDKLVNQDKNEQKRISSFLSMPISFYDTEHHPSKDNHRSANRYTDLTELELQNILIQIPFMSTYNK